VSAVDRGGRTIWIVHAHGYGKRFIVRADEMLTAFLEVERAIHQFCGELGLITPRTEIFTPALYGTQRSVIKSTRR
jgi:hypothetical protein